VGVEADGELAELPQLAELPELAELEDRPGRRRCPRVMRIA